MSAALGVRRQVRMGPALRVAPLPVGGLVLSAAFHALCLAIIVFGVDLLRQDESEIYIVNLVPTVAAIGSPGPPTPPAPAVPAPKPPPPPPRETPRETPPPPVAAPREVPSRPVPPPELPARELPRQEVTPRDLPPRPNTAAALPEPTLPARTPATPTPPRPEQKELPTVASARAPNAVAPNTPQPPAAARPAPESTSPVSVPALPAPASPPGQPTGSPVGTDEVTIDVDFPHAWYIQAMVRKIREHWDTRALPGQQPIITFDIARDGTVNVSRIKVRQSSGNSTYDQVAIRAIADSVPFPPLPADFRRDPLTVHIRFRFERDRG